MVLRKFINFILHLSTSSVYVLKQDLSMTLDVSVIIFSHFNGPTTLTYRAYLALHMFIHSAACKLKSFIHFLPIFCGINAVHLLETTLSTDRPWVHIMTCTC